MRELLDEKLREFEELEKKLLDPEIQTNSAKMSAVARQHGSLARLAGTYRKFQNLNGQITDANEMAQGADAEMRELAAAELPELKEQRETLWNNLLEMTIGGEDANRTRCVVEIRGGIGGDEAALFARDLYEMYKKHCETKGWKIEILDHRPTELGGFKEISFAVAGEGVYRELQYESGGHRVQRVPETEAKGRLQTSLATVAVMPEPEDVEVTIKPDDYRKDVYLASGPGGQHVNKTASAVRLTHHESGIVVSMQDEKSQHKNLAKALRILKTRIYEVRRQAEHDKRAEQRKTLVGSGDRSQRIRTYNFPDNRVTDHRINLSIYKLDQVLAGNVQVLTDALIDYDRKGQREAMGAID